MTKVQKGLKTFVKEIEIFLDILIVILAVLIYNNTIGKDQSTFREKLWFFIYIAACVIGHMFSSYFGNLNKLQFFSQQILREKIKNVMKDKKGKKFIMENIEESVLKDESI